MFSLVRFGGRALLDLGKHSRVDVSGDCIIDTVEGEYCGVRIYVCALWHREPLTKDIACELG